MPCVLLCYHISKNKISHMAELQTLQYTSCICNEYPHAGKAYEPHNAKEVCLLPDFIMHYLRPTSSCQNFGPSLNHQRNLKEGQSCQRKWDHCWFKSSEEWELDSIYLIILYSKILLGYLKFINVIEYYLNTYLIIIIFFHKKESKAIFSFTNYKFIVT